MVPSGLYNSCNPHAIGIIFIFLKEYLVRGTYQNIDQMMGNDEINLQQKERMEQNYYACPSPHERGDPPNDEGMPLCVPHHANKKRCMLELRMVPCCYCTADSVSTSIAKRQGSKIDSSIILFQKNSEQCAVLIATSSCFDD